MNFTLKTSILFALVALLGSFAGAQEKTATQDDDGTEVLFDGTDLSQWRGYGDEKVGAGWKIVDGTLMFDGESGGGDIVTKESYDNFELTFEWKVSKAANSGIMYRVSLGDPAPYFSGPEFQILDDSAHGDGKNELTSAGALYAMYAPQGKSLKEVGQWNTAKIVLNGNHVEHWLNGTQVVEAELHSDDWNEKLAASKFRNWKKFGKNESGHIAFQDHGDQVWYRNIRIKRIED